MTVLEILAQPATTGPLILTAKVLAVTGGLHLVAGLSLGYWLNGPRNWLREVVDFLVTLPLVFPPIAHGLRAAHAPGAQRAAGGLAGPGRGVQLFRA